MIYEKTFTVVKQHNYTSIQLYSFKVSILFLFQIAYKDHDDTCENNNINDIHITMNATADQGNLTTDSPQLLQTDGIYLAYNIYLGLCITLGLSLNMFVILVQFRNGDKTSNDWFITFVNVYDFIISTLIIPIYLTYTTGLWEQFRNDVICKIHMALTHFTIFRRLFL